MKLSGELHSLTALGRLLNSLGPIDVKKLNLRVLILRVLILIPATSVTLDTSLTELFISGPKMNILLSYC